MKNRSRSQLLIIGLLVVLGTPTLYSQEVSLNGQHRVTHHSRLSTSSTGHGYGKGGKPKPSPTPSADGESLWTGALTSDFNTTGNWTGVSGGHAPPIAGDVAWFPASPTTKSVNLSSSDNISGLYFSETGSSGYTLSNSNSAALTLTAYGTTVGTELGNDTAVAIGANNSTSSNTISAPLTLAPASGSVSTIYQANGGELIISGAISGSGITLSKTGDGILTLSGANDYSGGTTINAGTVKMSGSGTLGSTSGTLTMNGGILDLNGTNQSVGALNGSGGTILNELPSGLNGPKTLTIGNGDTSGSFSGTITDHDGSGSGFVKLVKVGTGTQTMSSTTSNYTGGTDINNGVLISNSSNGGALGTGAITVNDSGTLAGSGKIANNGLDAPITVNSGGTLMPGSTGSSGSYTTLQVGALTLNSGSTFSVDINGGTTAAGTGAGSLYDQVNALGKITLGGNLSLSLGSTALSIGDKFYIMTYTIGSGESGIFANTSNSGLTYTQGSDTFAVLYNDATVGGGLLSVSLQLTAIPEPRTYFAAALAMAALLITRRRQLSRLLKRA